MYKAGRMAVVDTDYAFTFPTAFVCTHYRQKMMKLVVSTLIMHLSSNFYNSGNYAHEYIYIFE